MSTMFVRSQCGKRWKTAYTEWCNGVSWHLCFLHLCNKWANINTGHHQTRLLHTAHSFNSLRPRQNGRHFADDVFKWIFLNENVLISIKMSLKFVPRGPISNIPALVQIMGWRLPGDKPLSEPIMVRLMTHICVTRPQWVKHVHIGTCYILDKGLHNPIEVFRFQLLWLDRNILTLTIGLFLLTWINFNTSMAWISNHMPSKVWDKITYLFPNSNGYTVEGLEWISNFIPHFVIDVITNPCCD